MGTKTVEKLAVIPGEHNLKNYEDIAANHDWGNTEKAFSWYETGKVNIAYEAIDRHVETHRKNKVALYYNDGHRKETYSFFDMKRNSNKAANVLKEKANLRKGDRIFVFMPRTPELYFSLLGALKIGAIVGPLFEAFM